MLEDTNSLDGAHIRVNAILWCHFIHAFVVLHTNSVTDDLNFLDRQVWANSVDPDQTASLILEHSDQGLYCLPFHLYLMEILLYVKSKLFKLVENTEFFSGTCIYIFLVFQGS